MERRASLSKHVEKNMFKKLQMFLQVNHFSMKTSTTCLFFLRRVAGVWGGAAVYVACSIMRLCKRGHRPKISNGALVRAVERVRWRKPSIPLWGAPVSACRIPKVSVEGGAGVYEVELCPEDLFSVL